MVRNVKTICAVFVFLFIAMLTVSFSVTSSASEVNYYTAEEYTNDDYLLNYDGTPSKKTIKTFATEVKSITQPGIYVELDKVIPRDFLETEEYDAVLQYNGKEYGFYIVKEYEYFDLLLIDFTYDTTAITNDDSTVEEPNEYERRMRVAPILQSHSYEFIPKVVADTFIKFMRDILMSMEI